MRRLCARAFVIVMAGTLVAISGCGQSDRPGGAEPDASGAPRRYSIAVVPKGMSHQFWLTVKAGAETAAKEANATIIWRGPSKETEVDKQISIIEDLISSRVDAIVMAACNEDALIGVVQRAIDAGIPVVTIDSGIASDIAVSFVATDNVAGARKAAEELARLIGEEGDVGLIPFVPGAATSEMREQGFKEGLKQFPRIRLVQTLYSQSDAAKGMSVTEDMMTANPGLKGIFAANEGGAIGAAQAVKAAGKAGTLKLVAFDASDEEIVALKDGSIQALVVQNPYRMGYLGVKAAIDHLEGRPVEKRIDTGVTLVTLDNFDDPETQQLLYPLKTP